jgi:broad specificity phosphatase PhoE
MALVYLVQHGEREPLPGDPGLTASGRRQAVMTARWLRGAGLQALYSSPLRRARETAGHIAAATGLPVRLDARLTERMNWDGSRPFEDFLADWEHATRDRGFVPGGGESSRQAGDRPRAFLAGLPAGPAPACAVTHGGVTTDLLRNLLPDQELPAGLAGAGIPPCAITAIDDLTVLMIAATAHLA